LAITSKNFFLGLLKKYFKNKVNERVKVDADVFRNTVGVLLTGNQPLVRIFNAAVEVRSHVTHE